MTVQPTRDQLRAHLRHLIAAWEGPGNPSVSVADLAHLLDQLDAAERRADEAEARVQAVEDVLERPIRHVDWDDPLVSATLVRHALEGGEDHDQGRGESHVG